MLLQNIFITLNVRPTAITDTLVNLLYLILHSYLFSHLPLLLFYWFTYKSFSFLRNIWVNHMVCWFVSVRKKFKVVTSILCVHSWLKMLFQIEHIVTSVHFLYWCLRNFKKESKSTFLLCYVTCIYCDITIFRWYERSFHVWSMKVKSLV